MPEINEVLKATILEVVANQLRDNDPPETKQPYQRLRKEGFSNQETRELIGTVVTGEIFNVMKEQKPYDRAGYVAALRRLPAMPGE